MGFGTPDGDCDGVSMHVRPTRLHQDKYRSLILQFLRSVRSKPYLLISTNQKRIKKERIVNPFFFLFLFKECINVNVTFRAVDGEGENSKIIFVVFNVFHI